MTDVQTAKQRGTEDPSKLTKIRSDDSKYHAAFMHNSWASFTAVRGFDRPLTQSRGMRVARSHYSALRG